MYFLKVAKSFFYLFFAFLPFQISAILSSGDVFYSGFFNPYLSHVLYLSDVLLALTIFFFGLSVVFREVKFKIRLGNKLIFWTLFLFLLAVVLSLFVSEDLNNGVYYLVRYCEFFVMYLLIVSRGFDLRHIKWVMVVSMFFVSIIGIWQYVAQSSLGLRFFGEPMISSVEVGVAKMSVMGESVMRAYGTFSHPNIFGGYLFFTIVFAVSLFFQEKKKRNKILVLSLLVVMISTLMLTFSRSALLALLVAFVVLFAFRDKKSFKVACNSSALFLIIGGLILFFGLRHEWITRFNFLDSNSLTERVLYLQSAMRMFYENIFGVGVGNFTLVMQDYTLVKLDPWLFQPVHNIFILVLSELGILGLLSFLSLFASMFSALLKKLKLFEARVQLALLSGVVVIGMLDHYFLTLYQGQALLFLLVAMVSLATSSVVKSGLPGNKR